MLQLIYLGKWKNTTLVASIGIPVSLSKLRLLWYLYLCQNYFYWDTCISVKITSIGIPVSLSKLLLLGHEIKSDIIFYEFHVIVLVLQIFGTHESTDASYVRSYYMNTYIIFATFFSRYLIILTEILRDASTYIFGKMKKHNIGGFYWDTCISVKFTSIGIPVPLSYRSVRRSH
jgi:hypothetical protein